MLSKVLIFQGFREFGDCSPWRLECLFLIRKGRFLISFSNFGGRTFSHMLISTLLGKGVGATGKPGHFRTLFPFSVSGKTVVGLLLRRRPLYPTELRVLIFQGFDGLWPSAVSPMYYTFFSFNCQCPEIPMFWRRISPDRPPGDLAGTCCPDSRYDLRILIAEHRPGRHDDACVDVFFQHV